MVLFKKYIIQFRDYLRRKPKHISFETIVPFDCDETLVLWEHDRDENNPEYKKFKCPYGQGYYYLKPHQKHIDLLKKYYYRGFGVIVWSHGGAAWAKEVVKILELEKYVHLTMGKMDRYVDDLPIKEWAGQRVYIKEK